MYTCVPALLLIYCTHPRLPQVEWLESFLVLQNIPMVIVSHDREFLDRVCTKIVDCQVELARRVG
jgi:ATPase subunit of ABC transporter with duplicated ATPase domains